MPAFLEEKVYCSELAVGRSPFGFVVVKFLKNVFNGGTSVLESFTVANLPYRPCG